MTIQSSLAMLLLISTILHAADDPRIAALRAADDKRVAAIVAADRGRLTGIFSDELRYAHSTGAVDDKASYIDLLVSGRTKYLVYDYEERNFSFPAPGIALMSGRVHIKSSTSDAISDGILSFLAVWREEKGGWQFLAWQSCKLPQPAAAAK
ncbi:MAG: nuclear transport factor 2 family protein [Verrucomicrobiaceae bacterium]|nr:MAG: nuclear transport factor 2 family protein [Verrucomicrobiaceae bacterium]